MRRISKQNRPKPPSGLFSHYEADIYNALVDDGVPRSDALEPFYVSERRFTSNPNYLRELRQRVANSLGVAESSASTGNLEEHGFGYYELDLIDFLFNQHRNRVLRVVGGVGVGKTTYLSYVFRCLRPKHEALMRFLPIYIGFMGYPSKTLRAEELPRLLFDSIISGLERETKINKYATESVSSALKILIAKKASLTNASSAYNLIQEIKQVFQGIEQVEPVFIIDNVDHLTSDSVEEISHFSRALFTETRFCVILAMRPPAFATHAETDAQKGAFYTFKISLPPPNLQSVFEKRLREVVTAETIDFEVKGTQYKFEVEDVNMAVRNIAANVLSQENERMILEGVANENVRKSAIAFLQFLSWPELRPDLMVAPAQESRTSGLPGGFREHLLKGMMLGRNQFYRDSPERRPVISNVLQFISTKHETDFLIQYRVLSLLSWARRTIDADTLVNWLLACGYSQEMVIDCLEHMLRRALVYSPETEEAFSRLRYISLSTSGAYYLSEFMSDPEYILELVPDLELDHYGFGPDGHDTFSARIRSIIELICRVEREEARQIKSVLNSNYKAQILGSLYREGFLQRRLIDVSRKLIKRMYRSEHAYVRETAIEVDDDIDTAIAATEAAEKKLAELTIGSNLLTPYNRSSPDVIQRMNVGDFRVDLKAPSILSAADPNSVLVECEFTSNDENTESIVGRLQILGHDVDEMVQLSRSGLSRVFRGEFNLSWGEDPSPLPELCLSLFADARPLMRRKISVRK